LSFISAPSEKTPLSKKLPVESQVINQGLYVRKHYDPLFLIVSLILQL
jgi:hypothetical protein